MYKYIILELFIIANTNSESKFMNKNGHRTLVDAIISEEQLKKTEDFTSVCEKGMKGMLNFYIGEIDLSKLNKEVEDYYEIMIVKCAVGKTYIFPSKNVTENVPFEEKPDLMDEDFDSVFIYDENYISKEFKQNYLIYDTTERCLPTFIVQFNVDQNKYKELQERMICELCEDNVAKKYCETEDAYFCINCDISHHQNRLGHKHKRTDIAEKPKVSGNCSIHPNIRLELFCPECNRPLCVNCKIKGDHSSGEFLMHPLIRISERYLETGDMLRDVDTHMDNKKKHLKQSIGLVENRLKDVNRKSTEIEEKIYEMMHKALKQLENLTKKKMSLLMSDHIELKRQLDEIQWIEKFIKFEYDVLSPNDFLLSWGRHMNVRKEITSNKFEPFKILPDMRVEGNVVITTEEESRKKPGAGGAGNKNFAGEDHDVGIFSPNKSGIFYKYEDKNSYLLKNKIEATIMREQDADDEAIEEKVIKSKSNLLSLSIMKHL